MRRQYTATATLNYGSIGANSTASLDVTVTGAQVGDNAMANPLYALEDNLIFCCRVSAANTVCIRVHNTSGGAIDPASGDWRVTVFSFA
jgi:hypothetical protein